MSLDVVTSKNLQDRAKADLLESIKKDLRQNYQFSLFSILPGLAKDVEAIEKLAKKLGIDSVLAKEFSARLLRAGLWKQDGANIQTDFEFLSLGDISIKDYLSMTVSIVAHLSEAKSYEYETLSLVTNRSHIRGFVGKVNTALRELHEKSLTTRDENDVLFSWTHTGVVELEMKKKATRVAEDELI